MIVYEFYLVTTDPSEIDAPSKMASDFAGAIWWGGPPGPQPAPWPASWAGSQRPTRASAADQGIRPTRRQPFIFTLRCAPLRMSTHLDYIVALGGAQRADP